MRATNADQYREKQRRREAHRRKCERVQHHCTTAPAAPPGRAVRPATPPDLAVRGPGRMEAVEVDGVVMPHRPVPDEDLSPRLQKLLAPSRPREKRTHRLALGNLFLVGRHAVVAATEALFRGDKKRRRQRRTGGDQ